MRQKHLIATVVGGLVLASVSAANAALITFRFEGTVSSLTDPGGVLAGLVASGDPFRIDYTFDSTAPDTVSNSIRGRYQSSLNVLTGTVGALGLSASGGATAIEVASAPNNDAYSVGGDVQLDVPGLRMLEFSVTAIDPTGMAFASDALPLLPPDLALFSTRRLAADGERINGARFGIEGSLTAITLVPEPASVFILLIGIGFAASRHTIRQSNR